KSTLGISQTREPLCPLDHDGRHQVAEHGRLASTRRAVDGERSTSLGQSPPDRIDRELLAESERKVVHAWPAPGGKAARRQLSPEEVKITANIDPLNSLEILIVTQE